MFGESQSQSRRVPSPWDHLISTPPSPNLKPLPKLVPEVEEGNVEYKLQLLSPSPTRFERLVTQLKWRLLEGRGQAYYELGVADSGALVGLPRADLEQSLETLEMMAGEIGASVIIVKEIEVPATMAGLAGSETDRRNGKRRTNKLVLSHSTNENDSTMSTTEPESPPTTDATDIEDDLATEEYGNSEFHLRTDTTRFLTSENSLSLVSVDLESELDVDLTSDSLRSTVSADLEIASVFKIRPTRKRVHHIHSGNTLTISSTPQFKSGKRLPGTKPKKHQRHQRLYNTDSNPVILDEERRSSEALDRAGKRRHARDCRRDEKRRALLTYTGHDRESVADNDEPAQDISNQQNTVIEVDLASELTSLHAAPSFSDAPLIPSGTTPDIHLERDEDGDDDSDIFMDRSSSTVNKPSNDTRLIVEALVVRKLSFEEAFLDFDGFSLTDSH